MAPVKISNVRKVYGNHEVVHGVSVDIEDGEFAILVGPSGCGKSTLLRMCAGLESITSGQIEIGGRVVNTVPPNERNIAMVFQNYALYPQMTVAQNMSFALELAKVPKVEIRAKVAATAEILGLGPLLGRFPRHLSGGQRQRVAMGRAIIREPAVFLFDEPLSNLDAKLRVRMRSEIKRLQQRLKTTSIYVTHDQIEALTMADKMVVMNEGIIEQAGAPMELFDRPANMFVAGFIGSPAMNFIPGRLESGDRPTLITADGQRLDLPGAPGVALGRDVVLGIRPEHVLAGASGGAEAVVTLVEPMGSEVLLNLNVGKEEVVCLSRQRLSATVGDTLPISLMQGPLHFFDPSTGSRL